MVNQVKLWTTKRIALKGTRIESDAGTTKEQSALSSKRNKTKASPIVGGFCKNFVLVRINCPDIIFNHLQFFMLKIFNRRLLVRRN